MFIKKDDTVIVITGKDKGKTGKIAKAFPREHKVLIAGINMLKKHQKARRGGEKGQVIEKPMPIHVSNVQLIDPSTNKRTRIGYSTTGDKKIRIAKKSGSTIA